MIEERIEAIEARLQKAENLPPATREELMTLLSALRREVASLPPEREEEASRIAHFAEASAHEATRERRQPALLDAALEGLTGSVEVFEVSHPQLAQTLNRLAVILANMGM